MSYKEAPELGQFIIYNVKKTGKSLGHGAFGDVEELIMDESTQCAGKVLHQAFLDPGNLGVDNILNKFVLECRLLADIRHPNIVQFMGICFFEGNPYPVLVMEKLDTSLDALLESREQLPFSVKLRIFIDISRGLVFLHGRRDPIIHRDLTTRNVLINEDSMSAKIADLGNARVMDKVTLSRTLTQAPGTAVYMPPEALEKKPDYTTSLDIFSFGHLALYTMNQIFPGDLLSPTYMDQYTQELHARSELDRRKDYMDLLYDKMGHDHAVTRIIEQCLSNRKEMRPTAKHVMEEMRKLVELQNDPYSYQEISKKANDPSRHQQGAGPKCMTQGILEIERSTVKFLSKKLAWKQYIFRVDGTVFQYIKGSKAVETIDLSNIISIETKPPVEGFFPFSLLFNGKGSPWNLRVDSEEERDRWTNILRSYIPGPIINRLEHIHAHNFPKPYEIPAPSNIGIQTPSYDVVKLPSASPAREHPLYEEIQNTLPSEYQNPVPSRNKPTTTSLHLYDDNIAKPKKRVDAMCQPTLEDPVYEVPPLSPTPPYYDSCDFSQKQSSSTRSEVQYHDQERPPPTIEFRSANLDPEPPIPPPRKHSRGIQAEYYTPMDYFPSTSPSTRNREASTESLGNNLQFSLEDLTKEQLLTYIQIIESSQSGNPQSHLSTQLKQQDTSPSSRSAENLSPKRSDLYVNIMTEDFTKDLPPPLPPKPAGISKSHSVLLTGSSAEAVRQRYQYKLRDNREGRVYFELAEEEEEEDEVFAQQAARHHFEESPPAVPQRCFSRRSESRHTESPRGLRRSHTMRAYLPSETVHQKQHMYQEGSQSSSTGDKQWQLPRQKPQRGSNPDIQVVRSMLGNILMNAKKMSSDKYLHIAEEDEDDRPQWATCMQSLRSTDQALTPEESLESLQKLALFIGKDDLYDMHQIGKGQFGKVYRAKLFRGKISIVVAVKTIRKYNSERETTEFMREQAIMSQMAHPNVVRLYGLVEQESPWIVLEYLPNGDLKRFLIAEKRPIKTLIKYMLDVALGMHYISERGLIHRDIAARNIMVGHDEVCKVGDFGLLRELPRDEDIYVSVSKSPAPIRWMAPESLERREFSTASDVWSYGVLLWEICQPSKLPYEGMDNYQCGLSVIQGHRLEIPSKYPSRVRKIMKACWHSTPTKRPSFLLIFNILTLIIFSTDFL